MPIKYGIWALFNLALDSKLRGCDLVATFLSAVSEIWGSTGGLVLGRTWNEKDSLCLRLGSLFKLMGCTQHKVRACVHEPVKKIHPRLVAESNSGAANQCRNVRFLRYRSGPEPLWY